MIKISFALLAVTFLLQSCSRQAFIQRNEDQIEGEWFFHRVRVTGFLDIDNVTNDFKDASMTFKNDYSVIYIKDDGTMLEGTWTYNIVDGTEETSYQLVLQLENKETGEDTLMLWDDFHVTDNRMWGQEDFDERRQINYQLRRQ